MKICFLVIVFLAISHTSYGQLDSLKIKQIELKVSEINSAKEKIISEKELIIDNNRITVEYLNNKILAKTVFKDKFSELKLEFYFDKDCLIFVHAIEPSPYYLDFEATLENYFYYEENLLIDHSKMYWTPNSMEVIPGKEFIQQFDYNTLFTSSYLKDYAENLLEIINRPKETSK